jgi:hypothetical protein
MALVGPIKLHKAASFTAVGVRYVPITLTGADIDLTDPNGPTGGISARSLAIGGTGGTVVVCCMDGTDNVTVPVSANTTVPLGVAKIYSAADGTTATPVGVYL